MCNNDTFTTKYKVQRYILRIIIEEQMSPKGERERDAARASPLPSPPIESTHVDDDVAGTRKGKEK